MLNCKLDSANEPHERKLKTRILCNRHVSRIFKMEGLALYKYIA